MPQIKIISPTANQTILGDKITVSFIAGDFTVSEDGYLNLWLDNPIEEASTAAKITGTFDYTLSDVPAGSHKLTLEAIKSNNHSFQPKVIQTVFFNTAFPPTSTVNPSPAPLSVFSVVNSINWQYVLLFFSILIIIMGIIVKSTLGKPKIWEN